MKNQVILRNPFEKKNLIAAENDIITAIRFILNHSFRRKPVISVKIVYGKFEQDAINNGNFAINKHHAFHYVSMRNIINTDNENVNTVLMFPSSTSILEIVDFVCSEIGNNKSTRGIIPLQMLKNRGVEVPLEQNYLDWGFPVKEIIVEEIVR